MAPINQYPHYIDSATAINLIREQVRATVELTNTQGGRGFKGALARTDRAAKALFKALTGRGPTREELEAAVN